MKWESVDTGWQGKGVEEGRSSSLSTSVIRPTGQQLRDVAKLWWSWEECALRVRNYSAFLSPPHAQGWVPPSYSRVFKLHCKKPRLLWDPAKVPQGRFGSRGRLWIFSEITSLYYALYIVIILLKTIPFSAFIQIIPTNTQKMLIFSQIRRLGQRRNSTELSSKRVKCISFVILWVM